MKRILCLTLSILLFVLSAQAAFAVSPGDLLYGDAFVHWNEQQIKQGIQNVPPEKLKAQRTFTTEDDAQIHTVDFSLKLIDTSEILQFAAEVSNFSDGEALLTMDLMPNGLANFREVLNHSINGDNDHSLPLHRRTISDSEYLVLEDRPYSGIKWPQQVTHTFEAWDEILETAFGLHLYQLGFYKLCPDHKLVSYRQEEADCNNDGKDYLHCETCRMETTVNIPGRNHLFGNPEIVKPASCFENGLQTETCTRCGFVLETDLPMIGMHTYQSKYMPATNKKDGYEREECTVCGQLFETREIPKIASVSLSATEYAYNGKVRKPKVIVKDRTGAVVPAGNYKVTYAKGRKAPGAYPVTVRMTGDDYKGTFHLRFTIRPQKVNGLKVNDKKLSWNKAPGAQKYVVCYRLGKNGEYKKLCTTTKIAVSLKKFSTGKTYFFFVKSYFRDSDAKLTIWGKPSSVLKYRVS